MGSGEARYFEVFQGVRIDAAGGKAARAVSDEIGFVFLIEDGFGHDGTRGIAGAKKQDVVPHGVVSGQMD